MGSAPRTLTFLVAAGAMLGCGGTTRPAGLDAPRADASVAVCGSYAPPIATAAGPAGPPPTTTCATTGRVVCDEGKASSILMPPPVIATAGVGAPPQATGGAVTPGDYQLVSVTVWGEPRPDDFDDPQPGGTLSAVLHVNCDTYDLVATVPTVPAGATQFEAGTTSRCGRLIPQSIPLAALVGFVDAGDPWHDLTPYAATADTLTLVQLVAYTDVTGLVVEGSLTIAREFALVGSAEDVPRDAGVAPCTPFATTPRDPRCPGSPAIGARCNPVPAPLQCEYGGDAYGRCTTRLVCALAPDGTFSFIVDPFAPAPDAGSCVSSPDSSTSACPASYTAATDATAPPSSPMCAYAGSLVCDYPEGVCGCGLSNAPDAWLCAARPPPGGPCPTIRPLAGTECSNPGQQCVYAPLCAPGIYAGPSMVCDNGYWEAFEVDIGCSTGIRL